MVEHDVICHGQFLTFFVAGEEYAIAILRVREILQYEALTRVPGTPAAVRGVCNLRGSVVPVIDLAVKFGLPESAISKWTCIVVVELELEGEKLVMGLVADSVSQVIDFRAEDIEPPPSFGTRVRVDHLLGMGKVDRRFVLILDIDRVLSTSEILAATTLDAGSAPLEAEPQAHPEPPGQPSEELQAT
jgi:purine-binding chemotaxis protein CheW